MDLTPRTGPDAARAAGSPVPTATRRRPPASRRARARVGVLVAVVLAAVAVILFQGLSNASLYFYNADEAVARRDEMGDERFRLQGQVVPGTIVAADGLVGFDVRFNGVTVAVSHVGDPPDLFQDCIPVVVEGRWQGEAFASDRIMVKHTNEYDAEHPERVPEGCPA